MRVFGFRLHPSEGVDVVLQEVTLESPGVFVVELMIRAISFCIRVSFSEVRDYDLVLRRELRSGDIPKAEDIGLRPWRASSDPSGQIFWGS